MGIFRSYIGLNSALAQNVIEVRGGSVVYEVDADLAYCNINEGDFEMMISFYDYTFMVLSS